MKPQVLPEKPESKGDAVQAMFRPQRTPHPTHATWAACPPQSCQGPAQERRLHLARLAQPPGPLQPGADAVLVIATWARNH